MVARQLKQLREAAGMSVRQVAAALEMSSSGYAHYENRYKEPLLPLPMVEALAPLFEARGISRQRTMLLAVPAAVEHGEPSSGPATDFLPSNQDSIPSTSDVRPAPNAPEVRHWTYPRDIKIMGTSECGDDGAFEINTGDTIGWAPRPPGLAGVKDVYAIYTEGDSMGRAYRPGQLVYVHTRKPLVPDCDVVIQLKPKREGEAPRAYLKTFLSKGAGGYRVKQWNPEKDIFFAVEQVLAVHRVLTLEELLNA